MCASENINVVPESLRDFANTFGRKNVNWDDEWAKISKLSGAVDSCRRYKLNDKSKTDFQKQQLEVSLQQVRNRIEAASGKFQALIETLNCAASEYAEVETLIANHFGGSTNKRSINEHGYNSYLNWCNKWKERYGDNLFTKALGSDLGQGLGSAAFGTAQDLSHPINFVSTLFCGGWGKAFVIPLVSAFAIWGARALGHEEDGYRIVGSANLINKLYSSGKSLKSAYKSLSRADEFVKVTGHKFSEIQSQMAKNYMGKQLHTFSTKSWSFYRGASSAVTTLGSNFSFQSSSANRFLKCW